MPFINWINWDERATGRNHPSRPDIVNRPLRETLSSLGLSPDDDISAPWARITVSATAPASPVVNDLWIDIS